MIIIAYIYKITNDINKKIYVGKTEHTNPELRWKEHLQDYKRRKNEKRPLYYAMRKYGVEHFHFEVVEETYNTEEREKYWIEKLRTYVGFEDCNGYNATLGGDGKSYLNLDEEEVIKYHTEEACYAIGETATFFKVDRGTIKNILKRKNVFWLNVKDSNRLSTYMKYGGIFQVSAQSKIILNVFKNTVEANIFMNKNKTCCTISDACSSRKGSHLTYGYLWYYGKDVPKAIENGEIIPIEDICDKYDVSLF